MKRIVTLGLSMFMLMAMQVNAQEEKPTLKINPTGRVLLDGAWYNSSDNDFKNGVALVDARVGVKASYGKYKAKLDIGYSYGKISLKDIYIERQFTPSTLLRVGNFVHQFGLQSSTSSSMKPTMEEPTSNEAFFNSRLLGAMVIFDKGHYFATASVHAESEALKKKSNELGTLGYGAMSRLVYRPFIDGKFLFQVGISGAYETARYNSDPEYNHSSFDLSANFPTRVASVKAVEAFIPNAKHLIKFTPELVAAYGRVAFEGQYYYVNVNRDKGYHNYNASGAYGILRGILIGGDYKHSHADCGIATPQPGSLEALVGYNYTDMSDAKAQVYGGHLNDVSFTLNYYINKYMIWRLRYSYTRATNRADLENAKVNTIQTRLQIIF